jgi:hypothetical protein
MIALAVCYFVGALAGVWVIHLTTPSPVEVASRAAASPAPRGASRRVLVAQLLDQRLGVLQVGGVEALGEPAADLGKHRAQRSPNLFLFVCQSP